MTASKLLPFGEKSGNISSPHLNDKESAIVGNSSNHASSVFDMQTLFSVLGYGNAMIRNLGRIPSESELQEVLRSLEDGQYLRDLYKKWWAPEVTGEFLSTPLTS